MYSWNNGYNIRLGVCLPISINKRHGGSLAL
nr:MAG TPA_asm: hypothetical protein [Caudoviricetes sp.]